MEDNKREQWLDLFMTAESRTELRSSIKYYLGCWADCMTAEEAYTASRQDDSVETYEVSTIQELYNIWDIDANK